MSCRLSLLALAISAPFTAAQALPELPSTASHHNGNNHHHDHLQSGEFRAIEQLIPKKQLIAQKHGAEPLHGPASRAAGTYWYIDAPGNFHGQAGQDKSVVTILKNKTNGYFIDLAANRPVFLSNTRALERDYNWNGVCIDANQKMLDLLIAQRSCRVIKAVITDKAGETVKFTRTPEVATEEKESSKFRQAQKELHDGEGGIVSDGMDNTEGLAKEKQWLVEEHTTTTLVDVLTHVGAPPIIDYLSLDIEGAEYLAMKAFDFTKWSFQVLTVERPKTELRALLRTYGYRYIMDHGCFGDQLWVAGSLAQAAADSLGVKLKPATHDQADPIKCNTEGLKHQVSGAGTPFFG